MESTENQLNTEASLLQNSMLSDEKLARFKEKLARSQYQSKIMHRFWACEAEITSYKKYKAGWDGEGSIEIDVLTRVSAIKFLKEIKDRILLISEDYIYPTGDGTIVIDFQNELDDLVSVEIGELSIGFFTQTEGQISQIGEGLESTIKAIDYVWDRSKTKDLPNHNDCDINYKQLYHELYEYVANLLVENIQHNWHPQALLSKWDNFRK